MLFLSLSQNTPNILNVKGSINTDHCLFLYKAVILRRMLSGQIADFYYFIANPSTLFCSGVKVKTL